MKGTIDQIVLARSEGSGMKHNSSFTFASKIRDYMMLIKFSLSFMVVFSAVVSYLLAPNIVEYDWLMIMLLFVAGLLVTGSANAVNQVVEKDTDALMKRTAKRPIASGRMSAEEGWTFAIDCRTCRCADPWLFLQLVVGRHRRIQLVCVCVYVHTTEKSEFGVGAGGCSSRSASLSDRLGGRAG